MSMTKEKTIEVLEHISQHITIRYIDGIEEIYISPEFKEAVNIALAIIRLSSEKQLTTKRRGEWIVSYDYIHNVTYAKCSKCGYERTLYGRYATHEGEPMGLEDFCPNCYSPMSNMAEQLEKEGCSITKMCDYDKSFTRQEMYEKTRHCLICRANPACLMHIKAIKEKYKAETKR